MVVTSSAWISRAKTGATREENRTVLKHFPLAFAFAMACFGNGKIVSFIFFAGARAGAGMFCA